MVFHDTDRKEVAYRMSKTEIGKRLRSLREKCGYTQIHIAKALNIDRSTYAYYESGKSVPKLEMFVALAELFSVSIEELIVVEDSRETVYLNDPGRQARRVNHLKSRAIPNNSHICDLEKGEKQLICFYRMMSREQKEAILHMAESMLKRKERPLPDGEGCEG